MIFDSDSLAFEILDVFKASRKKAAKVHNSERTFDALSYRYDADTIIETSSSSSHIYGSSVSFFPCAMDYIRHSKEEDLIVVHFRLFNYPSHDFEYFYPPNPEKYAALFEELFDCWNKKEPAYKQTAASLLYQIFALCYIDHFQPAQDKNILAESIDFIDRHCLECDFSLTEAAKCAFLSDGYFRRLFKKHYGISPKQYVIKKRISHAASLIATGYYSLRTVSSRCGYRDYKYFSIEFKRIMGISPSKYIYDRSAQKNKLLPQNEP